jgi:hypothetical protein
MSNVEDGKAFGFSGTNPFAAFIYLFPKIVLLLGQADNRVYIDGKRSNA